MSPSSCEAGRLSGTLAGVNADFRAPQVARPPAELTSFIGRIHERVELSHSSKPGGSPPVAVA